MESFEVVRLSDLGFQVLLRDPPANLVALACMDDVADALSEGRAVVLAVAVWSAPDLEGIELARSLAMGVGGDITVGIVPFDDPDEVADLWPEGSLRCAGQIWAVLRDGEIRWIAIGSTTEPELLCAVGGVS